jgi:hypothetical protein
LDIAFHLSWLGFQLDRNGDGRPYLTQLRIAAFAIAVGAALGAASAAHATFVIDKSCGVSQCDAGTKFFIDTDNKDVATFGGTVQGNAIAVDTTGNVDTGSGFATIKPTKDATLTDLIFTPADDTLFTDFSFRGQLEPAGFTGTIDVTWTDSSGTSGMLVFSGVKGPNSDFDRLGIVSTDGETLKSVSISTPGSESFKESKQVQFSGTGIAPSIPEPSTWAMMLAGFAGLGFVGYRASRRETAAIA